MPISVKTVNCRRRSTKPLSPFLAILSYDHSGHLHGNFFQKNVHQKLTQSGLFCKLKKRILFLTTFSELKSLKSPQRPFCPKSI